MCETTLTPVRDVRRWRESRRMSPEQDPTILQNIAYVRRKSGQNNTGRLKYTIKRL